MISVYFANLLLLFVPHELATNIKKITIIAFALAIVTTMGILNSASLSESAVYAQNSNFNAKLPGREEVPPTQSEATDIAEFTASGESVSYTVNAHNIQGITAGHIHNAEKCKK